MITVGPINHMFPVMPLPPPGLLLHRQEISEHSGNLLRETPSPGHRFKLSVDIFRIPLLANANAANHYDNLLLINSVNDTMPSELVLPIARQSATQRKSIAFRVDRQFIFQDLAQLISHAAIKSLNVSGGI